KLNVIYQLARRLLDQASESAGHSGLADHPLLRPGPYRRDILALVLAGAAAEGVLGRDSAQGAIRSAFWRNHFPGIEIYESYFAGGDWALSPQDPLVTRVLAEPPTSALMAATNPAPRPESTGKRTSVEGLPLSGELGMAISVADNGLLRVDALDPQRAAYASGLREGDLIRTVDGRRVKNHRELVEQILKTMTRRGATLQLVREGGAKAVVVRPVTAAERPGNGDAD
ncbi:MAG TPA: PDZ domain-containing protein, partial [candidate division Zixibacteria bacterium]|nr:PDZ domain-containing protein [candidate division Zixibacteria bacterium]